MMRKRRLPGWLLLFAAAAVPAVPVAALADEALRARLDGLRRASAPEVAGVRLSALPVLERFYRGRDYRFVWNVGEQVADLREAAETSRQDGFEPKEFHVREIEALVGHGSPSDLPEQSRIEAELILSDSLLRLVRYGRYGKVDPKALDKKWNHEDRPQPQRLAEDLARAAGTDDLHSELERMFRRPAFYSRLKAGLERYREIAASGGWPSVPAGRTLKPGMRDSRVPVIRQRLRVTGDFSGDEPADPKRYDPDLHTAVLGFQERHTLGVDGVIGPATLAAMNVSAERRVEQIRANLERMRWAGSDLPRDFLLVDIAAQEVDLFRDGVSVWNSRVIVGRSERPTPVFRDRVEYLQFNPTWTVPPTILKEDILPKARRDPGAVRKKGLTVIDRDGNIVAPEEVDWNVSANNLPYTLRQPPGDRNALGQVKFMFPNRYSIYLHDTPDRRLFKRAKRTFSSGCVRVERPLELAELLLEDPDWNQERFASVLASEEPRTVRLPKSMPVILSYWTAEAGEDGEVRFREDIYARDERVLAALNGDGRVLLASAPVPASGAAPVSAPEAAPRAEARAPENPQVEPPAQDPRRTGMAASSNEHANRIPPRRPSPAATSDRGGARVAEAAPEPRRKKRNWGTDLPGEGPLFEF